jgi:serine/threonine protein kinase
MNKSGTLAYMAPEVLTNSCFNGHSIDIWAAGVTLY